LRSTSVLALFNLLNRMYSEPPIFALVASLLVAIASGLAFYTTLTGSIRDWSIHRRETDRLVALQGYLLRLPITGVALGGCGFLVATLQIFAIPPKLSLAIAIPLTIGIGIAVWQQLMKLLNQLIQGGVKALDLEAVSLGEVNIPTSAFAPESESRSRRDS